MPSPLTPTPQLSLDTVARLRLTLLRLGRLLRQQVNTGVTPSQLSVLFTLDRRGPLALGELASIEQVQPPSVTRIVASLEEAGLVRRTVSPTDRRFATAELTPEGRRTIERIRRRRDAWLAGRIAGLTPEEVAALERALPVLERLVEEHQ